MIKALSIQVQPHRAPGIDIAAIQAVCEALTSLPLVARHEFKVGRDKTDYFNFTFGTEDLPALWLEIQTRLYADTHFRPWMTAASMVVCEGPRGWADYLQLYHFDPAVRRDALELTVVDPEEKKALEDIERYGCHIIQVMEEGEEPPFSYTVGVQKTSGTPEAVVVGLKEPIAHFVVDEYNRRVRRGERFVPGEQYNGFLEGFPVQFERVSRKHYYEYFGWNRWLYAGDAFEVFQIVYPTTDGVWPWDESASEWFLKRQPLLFRA